MHGVILLLLLTGWGEALAPQSAAANGGAVVEARSAGTEAAKASLRDDLERLIEATRWRNDAWSVLVVSLDRGDTLYSRTPDRVLAPASNVKLFTSAAALYYLGAQFRFNTFLLANGPVRDGVLEGDLVVYGTGDPTIAQRFGLKTAVWEAFADTLDALGVREIRGDIVGDASYFSGTGTGAGWQDTYIDAAYAAPASALSYSENIATVRIRPGQQAGWRPEVELVPGGDGIGIVNQATTVQRGSTTIRVSRSGYGGPLVVRGQIARNSKGVLRAVPVSDPARYTAAVVREVLAARGIAVTGVVRSVERAGESSVTGRSVFAPAFEQRAPMRVLAVHNSPPLLEILEVVNKDSHNLFAEQVLRAVGRVATGEGSVEGGVRAIAHMLGEGSGHGIPDGLELFDGSGLSPLNRASARAFIELLAFMQKSPMWPSFWFTLPEAGARDGLRRMAGTPAAHNLRAKTGTINRVSALSGYVRAGNGEQLAFSIVSNNVPSTWRAKRVEDAIGARLASFTRPTAGSGDAAPVVQANAPPVRADTTAATATPDTTRAATSAAAGTHAVQRGETLEGIARRYGVSVEAMRVANPGLEPRRMQAGTTIRVPLPDGAPPDGKVSAPTGRPTEYTIRSGDTLDAIARQHGTTVEALRRANPGLDPRRLIPGRKIRLK